ncbi:MAG: YIP1 family protein [bacterium]
MAIYGKDDKDELGIIRKLWDTLLHPRRNLGMIDGGNSRGAVFLMGFLYSAQYAFASLVGRGGIPRGSIVIVPLTVLIVGVAGSFLARWFAAGLIHLGVKLFGGPAVWTKTSTIWARAAGAISLPLLAADALLWLVCGNDLFALGATALEKRYGPLIRTWWLIQWGFLIWFLASLIIGLRDAYKISGWRAAGAVALWGAGIALLIAAIFVMGLIRGLASS